MADAKIRADLSLRSSAFEVGLFQAEGLVKSFARNAARLGVVSLIVNTAGFLEATRVVAGFERDMARVTALTAATQTQFTALNAEAQRLGATTRFSASEAAQGMGFLAQAGFEANKIVAETENVLNLAAVGMLELGRAADIASNIFTPFQQNDPLLSFDRVVDTLSQTASTTNTSVEQLGVAMRQVAPIASTLGVSVESTAAALGALGNAGIQAESAGTALRNIFLRLINPTAEVRSGVERLGLTLEELDPNKFDITAIFDKVAQASARLGDATAAGQASAEIFGVRSAAAAAVLAGSVSDVERFTYANEQAAGQTAKLAAVMNDSLDGALKSLKSRFEAVLLTLGGSDLGDKFRGLIESVTEGLASFNAADAAALGDKLSEGFAIAREAAAPFITAIGGVIKLTGALANAVLENKETFIQWARGLGTAYLVFKGFQFANFIKGLVTSTAKTGLLGVATTKSATAATKNAAALQRSTAATTTQTTANNALLISYSRMTPALQATTGALLANASAQSTFQKAGTQASNSFLRGFNKAGPALKTAIAKMGGFAVTGIIGWDLGTTIGKQFDEWLGVSDWGAKIINRLRGVVGEIDDVKPPTAFELRDELINAKTVAEENEARERILKEIATIEGQISSKQIDGKAASEATLNLRAAELKLLKKTVEEFEKLAGATERDQRLSRARSNAQAADHAREQAAWAKIVQQKTEAARLETVKAQEVEQAARLETLSRKVVEELGIGADLAKQIARSLIDNEGANTASKKTAEEIAQAKADAELTLNLLWAQAGVDFSQATPIAELKEVLNAINNVEINDEPILRQVHGLTELLEGLKGIEISPELDLGQIKEKLKEAVGSVSFDDLRNGIQMAFSALNNLPEKKLSAEEMLEDVSKVVNLVSGIQSEPVILVTEEETKKIQAIQAVQQDNQKKTLASNEESLRYATERYEVEKKIKEVAAEAENIRLQSLGRAEVATEIAEAEAQLTKTLADDRAVAEAKQRAEIIEQLTQRYKLTEEEATALAGRKLEIEQQIHDLRIKGSKEELAARIRLLAAEAKESGEDVDAVRRSQEIQRLTKEIAGEQEIGFKQARSIAEEIVRLEEKAAKLKEQQKASAKETDAIVQKTSKGILKRAISTGPVGSTSAVGGKESTISIKEFSASGIESFGGRLGTGFAQRTGTIIKSLERSSKRQEDASDATAKSTKTSAATATKAEAQASRASADSGQAKPLQILVNLMQRNVENTSNMVLEIQSLKEKLGVATV